MSPSRSQLASPWVSRVLGIALVLCVALIILGGRWAVVDRFGSDLPEWDQWDAEGLYSLVPWFENRDVLKSFLQPHNEHRVVLTKALNLFLTLANGQWDQRVECTANAVLVAALGGLLCFWATGFLSRPWQLLTFALVAVCWGLPLSWENTLAGFHSQQFFLIGLAFVTIVTLPNARPWHSKWFVGVVCAILSLGSMATGFFASAVVVGLLVITVITKQRRVVDILPTLAVCVVVIAVGLLTRVTVEYHEGYKAKNLGDFALTLLKAMQWPAPLLIGFALLLWSPWLWLTGVALGQRGSREKSDGANRGLEVWGLGAWVGLHLVATAYVRGSGGLPPPNRYLDTLIFGLFANVLALGWLSRYFAGDGRRRLILATLTVAWVGIFAWGAQREISAAIGRRLPDTAAAYRRSEGNVRNFLLTGDKTYLEKPDIPYTDPASLYPRITHPVLQKLLPTSVRPAIPVKVALMQGSFVEFDLRTKKQPFASLRISSKEAGQENGNNDAAALENQISWSSYGTEGPGGRGQWRTEAMRSTTAWLRFDTRGNVASSRVSLWLRKPRSGEVIGTAVPHAQAEDSSSRWTSAYVRAPRTLFILSASDDDPTAWLAFGAPVETGALSYFSLRLVGTGLTIAFSAAVAAIGFGLASWVVHTARSLGGRN
jgi:hypothetical protein